MSAEHYLTWQCSKIGTLIQLKYRSSWKSQYIMSRASGFSLCRKSHGYSFCPWLLCVSMTYSRKDLHELPPDLMQRAGPGEEGVEEQAHPVLTLQQQLLWGWAQKTLQPGKQGCSATHWNSPPCLMTEGQHSQTWIVLCSMCQVTTPEADSCAQPRGTQEVPMPKVSVGQDCSAPIPSPTSVSPPH